MYGVIVMEEKNPMKELKNKNIIKVETYFIEQRNLVELLKELISSEVKAIDPTIEKWYNTTSNCWVD